MNVLPEKWCILRTPENWKIITDFLNKNYNRSYCYNNPQFPYVSNNKTYNDSRSYAHPGYTLITFEDFKRLVLKQDTMNTQDKIKQLEEELNKLKEEVKKENEFKVGDYVVWVPTGYIGKINSPCRSYPKCWNIRLDGTKDGEYNSCHESNLRKATPEEISRATNQVKELYFGSTKVTIKKGSSYAETQYGNISKAEIKEIIDFFEQDFTILGHKMSIVNEGKWFIKFGCQRGEYQQIKEIYKAFE